MIFKFFTAVSLILFLTPCLRATDLSTLRAELQTAAKISDSLVRLQTYDKIVAALNSQGTEELNLATSWIYSKKEDKLNSKTVHTFSAMPTNGSNNALVVRFTSSRIPGESNAQILLPSFFVLGKDVTTVRGGYFSSDGEIVKQQEFGISRELKALLPQNRSSFFTFLTTVDRVSVIFKNPYNSIEDTLTFNVFGLKNAFVSNEVDYDQFVAILRDSK